MAIFAEGDEVYLSLPNLINDLSGSRSMNLGEFHLVEITFVNERRAEPAGASGAGDYIVVDKSYDVDIVERLISIQKKTTEYKKDYFENVPEHRIFPDTKREEALKDFTMQLGPYYNKRELFGHIFKMLGE